MVSMYNIYYVKIFITIQAIQEVIVVEESIHAVQYDIDRPVLIVAYTCIMIYIIA